MTSKDELAVNAIRILSISQIERANSGHPGLPMDAATMAYCLWNKFLKINPKNPDWVDRDRFILSAGHGSAMLYALLHLAGFDLTLDDLKDFRQVDSKTPGHPERLHTKGVEVTTGPLGQGLANGVGMAMAERHLAALYNREGYDIVDHYTYVLCGDGDLMEGISQEALSLAGKQELNKLILLYDSNDISLDGDLERSSVDKVKERFEAVNWNYLRVEDGNNLEEITTAIGEAKKSESAPTVIEIKTVIGYGSKNAGTSKVHGAPIGAEDYANAKKVYGRTAGDFEISDEIYQIFQDGLGKRGKEENDKWEETFKAYQKAYPKEAEDFLAGFERKLPENRIEKVNKYDSSMKAQASRVSSGEVIQDLAKVTPNLRGGSADLSSSTKTNIKESDYFGKDNPSGRNVAYGVREFAMAAAANGIIAHGGTFHYVSTFFVFSDYLKPAIRLSALSGLPTTYVFTHDSVAVGEDGPTHEPIEQLAALRSIPNTVVLRPADGNEVRLARKVAMESLDRPVVLALTRQNLKNLKETEDLTDLSQGAYIARDSQGESPDLILIATGSELALALDAEEILRQRGIDARVVSLPSMELFREQDEAFKEKILPTACKKRVSIEMGSSFGWGEFTGLDGINISIDRFGISGKASEVMDKLGFTPEKIAERILKEYY